MREAVKVGPRILLEAPKQWQGGMLIESLQAPVQLTFQEARACRSVSSGMLTGYFINSRGREFFSWLKTIDFKLEPLTLLLLFV